MLPETFFFLNDFSKTKDILNQGLGETRKKKWNLDIEYTIYVPEDKQFHIMAHGFEADGMDKFFGQIIDNHSPCNSIVKRKLNRNIIRVLFGGCLDELLGNAGRLHHPEELNEKQMDFSLFSKGDFHHDECPCASFSPNNIFSINYSVKKVE